MDRRRLWVAAGWGLVPLVVVLWAFFAPRTGAAVVEHPLRGVLPFVAVALTGACLGASGPDAGLQVGTAAALPGVVVGAGLGVGAALAVQHLFVVAGLALLFAALGGAGGWLGARLRAARA